MQLNTYPNTLMVTVMRIPPQNRYLFYATAVDEISYYTKLIQGRMLSAQSINEK